MEAVVMKKATDDMWNKLLSKDTLKYMTNVKDENGEVIEEKKSVKVFFEYIKTRVIDYKIIVMLAVRWKTLNDTQQASHAITYVGVNHATRFIIMMDYLAMKFEKGELK
jgi:hypothetical protein